MKKIFIALLTACAAFTCAFGLSACSDFIDIISHTHTYTNEWKFDSAYHWHECTVGGCTSKEINKAEHYDNDLDGKCDACKYVLGEGVQPPQDSQDPQDPEDGQTADNAEGIKLNKTELTLKVGESETLKVTFTPANPEDPRITWSTSNSGTVRVTSDGKVTAIAEGTATVTAKSVTEKIAICTVTVVKDNSDTPSSGTVTAVSGVTLNKSELALTAGANETLYATVTPSDATDKTINWSSSAIGIASVDANGKVTAVSAGTAVIIATTSNGKTATCTVTVTGASSTPVTPDNPDEVTSVALNKYTLTLYTGESQTLIATVNPSTATDKTVVWASSDTTKVLVSSTGTVTAVSAGMATVTATSSNGKKATCTVIVNAPSGEVESISLNKNSLSLEAGNSETLTVTIKPASVTNKTVTWKTSNNSVAKVDANGKVTAITAGTATISAAAPNGKTAYCLVTVTGTGTVNPPTPSANTLAYIEIRVNGQITAYAVKGIGTVTGTSIVIPDSYNGKPVTTISEGAFRGTTITSVTIGNNVTVIGKMAFYNCTRLTSVTIGIRVKVVCNQAFGGCGGLTNINIPDSVTDIADDAFDNGTLSSTNYNNGIYYGTSSNPYMILAGLQNYGVTSFVIHPNTKSIKTGALNGLSGGFNYINYDNAKYIGNGTNNYFVLVKAKDMNISSCEIPSNTKIIYDYAFSGCTNLTSMTIPGNVTSIGEHAFKGCTNMTSVTLSDGLTSIGENAFIASGLTSVTIPDSVTNVGEGAFSMCGSLISATIPGSVSSISDSMFSDCYSLTEVSIGEGITTIGWRAFSNCSSLTSVIIPDSVTTIGNNAFYQSGLNYIVLGSGLTSIGSSAFVNVSSLSKVYYRGTSSGWSGISITTPNNISSVTRYYYSAATQTSGNYWHYDTDGKTPLIW